MANSLFAIVNHDLPQTGKPKYESSISGLGISGGKDSSLVLKLLFKAYENKLIDQETIFFYCDTGVENPIIDTLVKNSIKTIEDFAHARDYPIEFKILKPEVHQRFFVRIIGRGYPPPTNFFRWCTKDLRIRPAEKLFRQMDIADCGLCLGIRNGESSQRDRLNKKNGNTYLLDYKTSSKERKIFAPIIDFETADVWEALCELEDCSPVDIDSLAHIYRGASGECPVIRDPRGSPCAKGRFGCWTCTVVRRDKSSENLIEEGYHELKPYLAFRNWLSVFRNNEAMRCKKRRNGTQGLGPFTLEARQIILNKIRSLESEIDQKIVNREELLEIQRLWELDIKDGRFV